jgi:hypothetical protein
VGNFIKNNMLVNNVYTPENNVAPVPPTSTPTPVVPQPTIPPVTPVVPAPVIVPPTPPTPPTPPVEPPKPVTPPTVAPTNIPPIPPSMTPPKEGNSWKRNVLVLFLLIVIAGLGVYAYQTFMGTKNSTSNQATIDPILYVIPEEERAQYLEARAKFEQQNK